MSEVKTSMRGALGLGRSVAVSTTGGGVCVGPTIEVGLGPPVGLARGSVGVAVSVGARRGVTEARGDAVTDGVTAAVGITGSRTPPQPASRTPNST